MSEGNQKSTTDEKATGAARSDGGNTIENTKVLIRAALAGGTLIGFFSMLIYLIRILP